MSAAAFLLSTLFLLTGCVSPADGDPTVMSPARAFLSGLGKDHVLIGASMTDESAAAAPFEVRYLYIAGGVFDGFEPCRNPNCAGRTHVCGPGGTVCVDGNCHWWGCWQWDALPPGQYILDFIAAAKAENQIPFISYYQVLQSAETGEGAPEVAAVNDPGLMGRYLADWRFLLQKIGNGTVLLQIEPDFWAYAQQAGSNPDGIPAAVASADFVDGTGYANTLAGLARCMIAMVRKYAPNAKVGLHASCWSTGYDCLNNSDPSLDVAAEAAKTAAFLIKCGSSDFISVDLCDRDAGYYRSMGRDVFWDTSNAALPNFRQMGAWIKAVSAVTRKAVIVWQVPVGNMGQNDTPYHWRDNRVDYLFAHMKDLASANVAAVLYGAGADGQTTPETDGGNLIGKTVDYMKAGGQKL
jgi:hypothetical protein